MRLLIFILLLLASTPALAQLNADFSASTTQACTGINVQFKDNSSGSPISWFWDFGDGQTSTLQNPVITYTTSGKYTIRLTIKNGSEQDYEQKTNYITVYTTPQADFSVAGPDSGCAALSTSFQDASLTLGATINSWQWNFGDGQTSTLQNPSHTYNTQGRYNVSLVIQTSQGCSSTKQINNAVIAGDKPVVDFSASPLKGCASAVRNFKNKTNGNASGFWWEFGDGKISNAKSPAHHYQDTGYFNVKLKVSMNGCIDSFAIPNYIHVDGAAAKFNRFMDCSDPVTFKYNDLSIAETGRMWDFDDGTTSTDKYVTHTFSNPGMYIVKLYVTGTGCNDSAYDTVYIKRGNPKVNIVPAKSIYCRNDTTLLYVNGYDSISTRNFTWDFGDGTPQVFTKTRDSINHVYSNNGSYLPKIYIKNVYNCVDTFTYDKAIPVNSPSANFQSIETGCTNADITFKNQSAAGGDRQITNWLWSYGDGDTANGSGPVRYAYIFPGTYNVFLKVTDEDGCTDTITHQIEINNSPTVDAGIDTFTCAGTSTTLNPSGADSYTWQNSSDLSCTNCANPVAAPQQSATYFVTGTTAGCSATDSVHIDVQQKQIVTLEATEYQICSGGNSVMLNASGADNYSWTPANTLSSTIVSNPVAFPSVTTTYTVTGSDSRSCFTDNASATVIVNGKPSVSIADSVVQIMTGFNFTIPGSAGPDVSSFEWIPTTGLSCADCLQPTITVTNNSTYTLVGTNQFGCTDTASITIIAACTGNAIFMPNTFSPNNDGMNDYFYPRSSNTINIKSLSIFNRWGQLVFQKQNFNTNNASYGWDGKYRGKLQQADVYVYIMELQCAGDKVFLKKGDISLIR